MNRIKDKYIEGIDYVIDPDILGPSCPLSLEEINMSLISLLGENIVDISWNEDHWEFTLNSTWAN